MCASDVPGFGLAKGLAVTAAIFQIIFTIFTLFPPWDEPYSIVLKLICILGGVLGAYVACKIGCCSGSFSAANPTAINLGTLKTVAFVSGVFLLIGALMSFGGSAFVGEIHDNIDSQQCTAVQACWASNTDSCNAIQNCDCYSSQAECNNDKGTADCSLQVYTYYRWCDTTQDNDYDFCRAESYWNPLECEQNRKDSRDFVGLFWIIVIVWGVIYLLITACTCGLGCSLSKVQGNVKGLPAETPAAGAPVVATVVQAQVVEATLATPSDV